MVTGCAIQTIPINTVGSERGLAPDARLTITFDWLSDLMIPGLYLTDAWTISGSAVAQPSVGGRALHGEERGGGGSPWSTLNHSTGASVHPLEDEQNHKETRSTERWGSVMSKGSCSGDEAFAVMPIIS